MRNKYFIDDDEIIGKRFGKLVAKERNGNDKWGFRAWLCSCDCGGEITVSGSTLLQHKTFSCGCIIRGFKHGLSRHPIYSVYNDMLERCYNKKCANYKYYGARGIMVCNEWKNDFMSFYNWSISNGWIKGLSIDRFPNKNGAYEPQNCRWATRELQNNNRTDNRILECRGITATLSQFSRMSGIAYKTISCRIDRGWEIERAIFEPIPRKKS